MKGELYNPMTGARLDLEVTKEDGAAAAKTHARWRAKRIAVLQGLIRDREVGPFARNIYRRELARLEAEP